MDLENFWFCLIAVLWGGYFLLEGFDFGVGMLLPFLPRDERRARRRCSSRSARSGTATRSGSSSPAAPTFAAFPAWYATMFSGFYLALLLHPRPPDRPRRLVRVAREERQPALAARLAVGERRRQLRHRADLGHRRSRTSSTACRSTRPATSPATSGTSSPATRCSAGSPFVLLFAFHGATFLTLRTTRRSAASARGRAALTACAARAVRSAAAFLIWTVAVAVDRNDKNVFPPVLPAAIAIGAFVLAVVFVYLGRSGVGVRAHRRRRRWASSRRSSPALYPRVMVSSPDFANSLTVAERRVRALHAGGHDASSPLICVPLVLLYQGWTYHVFRAHGSAASVSPDARLRPMAAFDRRLLDRAHEARTALGGRRGRSASSLRCSSSPRRCCSRRSPPARSTARPCTRSLRPLALLAAVVCARAAAGWGFEVVGRRAAASHPLAAAAEPRRAPAPRRSPPRSTGRELPSSRPLAVHGRRRARGDLRPLPAAGRAGRARSRSPCSRSVASIDLTSAGDHAADAAARAGLHVADRALHRAAARASAGRRCALLAHALPRRRPRPADAARLQPRRGAGRADRRGQRALPARRRWARCASRSSRARCWSSRRRSASRSSR